MVSRTTQSIIDSLRDQQRLMQKGLKPLLKQVETLEEELTAITSAIAALEGDAPVPQTVNQRRKSARRRSGRSGNGVSLPQVLEIVTGLLTEKHFLERETIKARVAATIVELGKSTQGLHFVLARALQDGRFRERDGEYKLKERFCLKGDT